MSGKKSSAPATGYKAIVARWRDEGRETVTVPMIAKALHVSNQTVRGLAIPDAGLGRQAKHYLDDVEAALRAHAEAKAADGVKVKPAKAS